MPEVIEPERFKTEVSKESDFGKKFLKFRTSTERRCYFCGTTEGLESHYLVTNLSITAFDDPITCDCFVACDDCSDDWRKAMNKMIDKRIERLEEKDAKSKS